MPPTPKPHGAKKKANVAVPSAGGGIDRRLLLGGGGAAVLAVAVVVVGYLLLAGGGSGDAPKLLEAAGCDVKAVNALAGEHSITSASGTSGKWNTSPPTSGPHFQVPAIWGSYKEPLLPAQVVHNLEHGGIFIQYGEDVSQETIAELQGFYDRHKNGTLLAPFPSLGAKIALGAWTSKGGSDHGTAYLATCPTFDEKAYSAFLAAYQFKGPERFPKDSLHPGAQ